MAARSRLYNVHDAKTQLSKLLRQAAEGDEVIIAKAGVPAVRLVPVVHRTAERPLGTESGRIRLAADFDAPLSPEVLALFEK